MGMQESRNSLLLVCIPCVLVLLAQGFRKSHLRREPNFFMAGLGYFAINLFTPALLFMLPLILCMCVMTGGGGGDGGGEGMSMFDFGGDGAGDAAGGMGDAAGGAAEGAGSA